MGEGMAKILKLLEEVKPLLKPIKAHPLEKKAEHVKELYITLLLAVLQGGKELEKKKEGFLMALLQGIAMKIELSSYRAGASKIDKEKITEFVYWIKKEKLQHIFLVDLLLLMGMEGEMEEEGFVLAGELADVLEITEKEVEFLCEMTICILEQSSSKFKELLEKIPSTIALDDFKVYVMDFVEEYPIQESYLSGVVEWRGSLLIDKTIFNEGCLKVSNCTIRFEKQGKIISRKGSQIYIENTEIENGEWIFEEVSTLHIQNSKFNNCVDKRALSIYRCNREAVIQDSSFENCTLYGEKNGGAIEIIESAVRLERLFFHMCITDGYGGALFIKTTGGERCNVKGVEFYECQADYGGGVYIVEEQIQYIFLDCSWKRCKAMVGGGIWRMGGKRIIPCIVNCEFHQCGIAYEGKRGGYAGSQFMNYMEVAEAIENCRFTQCESNPVYAY